MIRLENVTIARGGKPLLTDVSLTIEVGEKVVVTGPSGCGKSTLLGAIVGAVPVSSGTIHFGPGKGVGDLLPERPGGCCAQKVPDTFSGADGFEVSPSTILEVRRRISFIGQEPALAAETIDEAIRLPFTFRANRHLRPSDEDIEAAIGRLGLPTDILPKRCAVVSGGEKQRVAIARAILLGKQIFLLDEVTSALDPESRERVLGLFKTEEFTILSVSHDSTWLAMCDRELKIVDGRVVG